MNVRIAIPEPTSGDRGYNERSLPVYLAALDAAGTTPVMIPLRERQERVAKLLAETQGILLPGSRFDIDPQIYGEERISECGPADPGRTAVDELMLQDAFNLRKPILAICGGAQALNVWRNGTLIQDLKTGVDHQPGRDVLEAHRVRVAPGSRLAAAVPEGASGDPWINSSHHQAVRRVGDNLVVSAVSPEDGVVEAIELASREHFVVGVQWHPERTYFTSAFSQGIFAAFVRATEQFEPRRIEESVAGR
ncbi:MAG: gamma-glutamyl-gamma-aminobutyrate hydrolase family protein [Terracidiphilus sp.]